MNLAADQEIFILPDSRRLYRTVCGNKNIVHGCTVQDILEVMLSFFLLSWFGLDDFFDIEEEIFEEVVKLFQEESISFDAPVCNQIFQIAVPSINRDCL